MNDYTNREKGLQQLIANETGVAKSIVSRYFNSKYIGNKNRLTIEQCLSRMGRNHMKNPNTPIKSPSKNPPKKRTDILNNIKHGDMSIIANKFNTSNVHISHILSGTNQLVNIKTELSKNIIREAELMAAINIWKTRFCKFESLL